jgi:hypothetical protein
MDSLSELFHLLNVFCTSFRLSLSQVQKSVVFRLRFRYSDHLYVLVSRLAILLCITSITGSFLLSTATFNYIVWYSELHHYLARRTIKSSNVKCIRYAGDAFTPFQACQTLSHRSQHVRCKTFPSHPSHSTPCSSSYPLCII